MINRPGRRLVLAIAAAALAWLTAGGTAAAATYYVRLSGNDWNVGTGPSTAFRTVTKAASVVVVGDTIYVGAGTYDGYAPQSADGTSTARIRYIADTAGTHTGDAGTVTIRPGATYSGADGYWLGLAIYGDYTTVEGFAFERNTPSDTRTSYPAGAAYCTGVRYENCRFQNCTGGFGALSGAGVTVAGCVFEGCTSSALQTRLATATVSGCTFTNNVQGLFGESSTLTVTNCTFTCTVATGTHVRLDDSAATLSNCTMTGGGYGVYQSSGAGATLLDCTVANAQTVGLWLAGLATEVGNCEISGSATGVYLPLPAGIAAEPYIHDSVVRDCGTGINAAWSGLSLRLTALSGHTGAGLRIASTVSSFTLGALDTVTIDDCRFGLAWDGDAGVAQSLTVDTKTWSGNQDHLYTTNVESVVARNLSLANGHGGVLTFGADQLTVTNCAFADSVPNGDGNTEAAIYTQAATVTVADCTIDRWYHGLHLTGATDPDLQRLTVRESGRDAIRLEDSAWNWLAADAVTLTDNWISVYSLNSDLTVDGGAPGIVVTGPAGSPAGSFGLIAQGGTTSWTGVTVSSAERGFDVRQTRGLTVRDCTADGCLGWGLYVVRDPADPAPVAAVIDGFTATGCGEGVCYRRGAGAATGVGQVELRRIAVTRAAATDADGYLIADPGGTGVLLTDCPTDPALHSDLTVAGYGTGLWVHQADLTVTPAMGLTVRECRYGVVVVTGTTSISGWACDRVWFGAALYPDGGAVALTDCDLVGRNGAVYVEDGGDFAAEHCTFAARNGDAVFIQAATPADLAVTDCTVAAAGIDGFRVRFTGGSGNLHFDGCTVLAAGDDGYDLGDGATTLRDCAARGIGDQGFRVVRGAAALNRCAAEGCGTDGFYLGDCPTATVRDCAAIACLGFGTELDDGCGSVRFDNFLAYGGSRGAMCEAPGATVTMNHVTLDGSDEALRVFDGAVVVTNAVLTGPRRAAEQSGAGTIALDHVLLFAPTPYFNVSPGPDDLLGDPLFRDAASGDLRLAAGSPAINVGKDLAGVVDADLNGAARPSYGRFDLGAYEYLEVGGSLRILDWREQAN